MRVETVQANDPATRVVGVVGTGTDQLRRVAMTADDLQRLTILETRHCFDGDGRMLDWRPRRKVL